MIAEAQKDPAWEQLPRIPYLGPVRVSLLLAVMQTPWRFRTKRNLCAYCGLAVVTHSSSEYALQEGRVVRRQRARLTRGLTRNHNRVLKDLFKAAATAASARPGPLQELYHAMVDRGLIAQEESTSQSAGDECVLDNLSHRTHKLTSAGLGCCAGGPR
jgi:hypothetical protein